MSGAAGPAGRPSVWPSTSQSLSGIRGAGGEAVAPCGTGNGWSSEFETIRIRLTDFQNNGSGVQLARVRKIAFRFGTGAGSAQGRLALDEVELVNN